MPERGTAEPTRRYLISSEQIRVAYILGSAGMIVTILLLFLLVTVRPQGQLRAVDGSGHLASREAARDRLAGYELLGQERARIDIDEAMTLVLERGLDLGLQPPPPPGRP